MKLNIALSILFAIVTYFSAIHELEHITHDANAECLVHHVNDNLAAVDIVDYSKEIEIFHFDKISQNNSIFTLHVKNKSNPNRAPPIFIS